jgi:integrator complex subunit 6
MGDFQEYTRRLSEIGMAPLRELEQSAVRTHTFGNPFKLDKKSMTVDEVLEIPGANTNANNGQTPPATSFQNGRRYGLKRKAQG